MQTALTRKLLASSLVFASIMAPIQRTAVPTTAFQDQKPGTSGLRKKVKVFQQPNYIANFVQATFNALRADGAGGVPPVLVVGGDGRFFCPEACQTIIEVAAGNGVRRVLVGQHGLLSTPAVSAVVRTREGGGVAGGAFILTASHNPGGPDEDFGIKYNGANGGPAPEKLTDAIFAETTTLHEFSTAAVPTIDLATLASLAVADDFSVEVISSTEDYVALLRTVFDFTAIERLLARPDFSFVFDAMHGVGGPYAHAIFVGALGADPRSLVNCAPSPDFGGGHPDPNLTYAPELVRTMGLTREGTLLPLADAPTVPAFGAASDGDADRNMILGGRFFVTPSDSVAVIAANSRAIPFFARAGGVRSVARSMPTSAALDRVAAKLGIPVFEVPTGWKFFGNLMDSAALFGKQDYNPLICGEESFGTGSNHVREKDGIWAVLAWLSILAERNGCASDAAATTDKPLVTVATVVREHWAEFGRNYYCRYDYENVAGAAADKLMELMRIKSPSDVPALNGVPCATVDDFAYTDPVDASVSRKQGVRVVFADGSRFVLRLSGTGSSGATIRLYIERYVAPADAAAQLVAGEMPPTAEVLAPLAQVALEVSQLQALTGRDAPTVIT